MLRRAIKFVETLSPVESVFDCACNTGFWLGQAQRWAPEADLVGVDTDATSVQTGRSMHAGIELHHGDCRNILTNLDRQFDMILCMGVLYYYYDIEGFLTKLAQHCRVGMLVDTVVMREPEAAIADVETPRVVALQNQPNEMTRAAAETRGQVRIPNRAALEKTLRSYGFYTRRIDYYTGTYDESVGGRLGHPLECIGVLAVRRENARSADRSWSGWANTMLEGRVVNTAYGAGEPPAQQAADRDPALIADD
jgi:trans-aconitate methyltransferase